MSTVLLDAIPIWNQEENKSCHSQEDSIAGSPWKFKIKPISKLEFLQDLLDLNSTRRIIWNYGNSAFRRVEDQPRNNL